MGVPIKPPNRGRLVDVFIANLSTDSDPERLKEILLELDERDAQWETPTHRLIAKFAAGLISAGFLAAYVFVESPPKATVLVTVGAIGWAAFLYDSLGEKAAEFGARLAHWIRARR